MSDGVMLLGGRSRRGLQSVDIPGVGCLVLGLRKRQRGPDCTTRGFHDLRALVLNELADLQQAGPPAFTVGVLAATHGPLLSQWPVTLPLLPHLQEVDHALQNLCLSHLWVLQVLMGAR